MADKQPGLQTCECATFVMNSVSGSDTVGFWSTVLDRCFDEACYSKELLKKHVYAILSHWLLQFKAQSPGTHANMPPQFHSAAIHYRRFWVYGV